MTNVGSLRWVRAPQQARSQDTLQRLLDAAEQLLEEAPWDAITVAALVQRARSSVGAFYARFPDKDALIQHLHQRRSAEAIQTADTVLARERWKNVPVVEMVRAIVEFTTREYVEHAGFHREIVRRNSIDARFRDRSTNVASHVSRLIASILEDHRAEFVSLQSLHAADMCHRILFAVLDQHAQFYDRGPGVIPLPSEQLVDELVRALLGYLGLKAPPP